MKRACFLLQVKKNRLEEYKEIHKNVWPEMLNAISESGVKNYSLFLRPDGLLVGYFEADDPRLSLKRLGETEINAKWQALTGPFFDSGSGDMEKGSLEWLEQVFYLE